MYFSHDTFKPDFSLRQSKPTLIKLVREKLNIWAKTGNFFTNNALVHSSINYYLKALITDESIGLSLNVDNTLIALTRNLDN